MTVKTYSVSLIATLLTAATPSLYAMDAGDDQLHGEEIHQDHCYKCHGDELYTRENRVVKSLSALGKQVRVCKDNTGAPWFDEDTEAVVKFLNSKYYKF